MKSSRHFSKATLVATVHDTAQQHNPQLLSVKAGVHNSNELRVTANPVVSEQNPPHITSLKCTVENW